MGLWERKIVDARSAALRIGNAYHASKNFGETADDVAVKLNVVNGDVSTMYAVFSVACGGPVDVAIYEDSTSTGGDALFVRAMNRDYSDRDINAVGTVHGVTVLSAPTTSGGTLLTDIHQGEGMPDSQPFSGEIALKTGSTYTVVATNRAAAAKHISIAVDFYPM